MKLNRKLVLVLALLMSVAMITTGTLAYLTDRDSDVNVFTVGNVDITLEEDFVQGSELVPGVDIDKVPTITNTGKTDAWVWMTVAVPAGLESDVASDNIVHWNWMAVTDEAYMNNKTQADVDAKIAEGKLPEGTTIEQILAGQNWDVEGTIPMGKETIDGVTYNVYLMKYNDVLQPGETTLASLHNVYLDPHVDIDPEGNLAWVENGVATDLNYNINDMGNPKIYVSAYGMQVDGFDTVDDAYEAYGEQWGENGGINYGATEKVSSSEAFKDAVTANKEHIVIDLEEDVTYDVTAWNELAMGGTKTDTITINGNGHTITFNHKNGDWNHITTGETGAKLNIINAHLTNSGHNDSAWNRHDLNFACDVSLVDVTTDKAIALKAGATLKNVTISDANTSDTYAIWIQPKGQTVSLEDVVIDMLDCSDGRGIKIDEQYLSEEEKGKVTLNVTDTIFKTEEKSAILVKSSMGADITLENVDITEAAADTTNPVWVDEASSAYADLVTVTGGTKIVEP